MEGDNVQIRALVQRESILTTPAVLLISRDAELCRVVQQTQPHGATLCIVADAATAPGDRFTDVWMDLDTASDNSTLLGTRVYFHSSPAETQRARLSGRFVRKPCDVSFMELLWASLLGNTKRKHRSAHPEPALPRWALEFHDLRLRRLCRRMSTRLPGKLGYRDISIYLYDGERGVYTLAESTLQRPIDLALRAREDADRLLVAVAARGELVETDDVAALRNALGLAAPQETRPYADSACLIAPLICDGQLLGAACLSTRAHPARTARRCPRNLLFRFVARCVMHAREHERALNEARIDALTGLYNVRYLGEALHREVRRTARFRQPLTAIAIDLDELKGVNDRHGHAAGDFMLRHVARAIVSVLRQCDIAARIGGDEFVALLPATVLDGGRQVALRLLKSLREDAPCFRGIPLSIRASIGVVEWQPEWSPQEFIEAADRTLYEAKNGGRDRIALCENQVRPPIGPSRFTAEPAMANLASILARTGGAVARDAS